jgi:3-deoxy-D-manno-octulosonic acid kinase
MSREMAGEARIELDGPAGRGAIVFDPTRVEQARADWFDAPAWGALATPVSTGGRGAAWFVDAPFGAVVLRHYRRGGLAARVSRDRYWWSGEASVRGVAEFRLLREAARRGVPVPRPVATLYVRRGAHYRASILLDRIPGARTFAELVIDGAAPWEDAGRLVARAHRAGLDHADLNADNILFDASGGSHLIDLDRGMLRTLGNGWRRRNLERLHRSLLKRRGVRTAAEIESGFTALTAAYEEALNA